MKKIILITGISSGFGKAASRLLAEAGHTVYGTVRRDCETDKSINVLRMDLTDAGSIHEAVETVISKEGRIDVLINNAGMHSAGPVETIPAEYIRLQVDTNFLGMVYLTKAVLPYMRKQGSGMIINFSSIAGLMGLPFHTFYCACKFAIEGFTESLRMEVDQFNIKIILINPGDFNTNNTNARRKFLAPTGPEDPYNKQFMTALEIMEKNELAGKKPVFLARKIVRIVECKNPKQRYIIGALYEKIAVRLKYILPGKFFRWIFALPKFLPNDWRGPFILLVFICFISSFLDNIAAALIGGAIAMVVFKGKVHIGFIAAIVAASNAGGSGSVVGDTTTTMMWIDGVSPLNVLHGFIAALTALVFFAWFASHQQDKYQRIQNDPNKVVKIDWMKLLIVFMMLIGAIISNFLYDMPALGVWIAILIGAILRPIPWKEVPGAIKGTVFLLCLVFCASLNAS